MSSAAPAGTSRSSKRTSRIGGRVWTIRGGDRIVQTGREDQLCAFDRGHYFNAGAARIPHVHHTILGYAKRLGVPIEVMVNSNRAAKWDFGGRVYEDRQVRNGVSGPLRRIARARRSTGTRSIRS